MVLPELNNPNNFKTFKSEIKKVETNAMQMKTLKHLPHMQNETLVQVFSCEFCEISKNTFLHRTPLVAASENIRVRKVTVVFRTLSTSVIEVFYENS